MGAIDNSSYWQLNGVDILKASTDLRDLRRKEIVNQKGKGKATCYVGGSNLVVSTNDVLNTPPDALNTPPDSPNTPPNSEVSEELLLKINELKKRINDPERVKELIKEVCMIRAWKASDLAMIFNKEEDYFKRKYLSEMIAQKDLVYLHAEMIHHPDQAYLTPQSENK